MPNFDPALLERIKSLVPISRLVGEYVEADKAKSRPGDTYALCPYHGEKSASFHGEDSMGRVHCFGCGVTDDHFAFVSHMTGASFPEAVQIVADMAGEVLPGARQARPSGKPTPKYDPPALSDPYEHYEFITVPSDTPPLSSRPKDPAPAQP